jgi:hypothetical protein
LVFVRDVAPAIVTVCAARGEPVMEAVYPVDMLLVRVLLKVTGIVE